MTSRRRYVIEFQNCYFIKRFALVQSIIPANLVAISQLLSELEGLRQNDVMTSRRRYVIEIQKTKSVITPALVQSIIPQNLVAISQETKKFKRL